MEACKQVDITERRTAAKQRLRQRARRRMTNHIKQGFNKYIERQIRLSRLSPFNIHRKYYVAHDYSVQPLDGPINKNDQTDNVDPYEGQDLMNIDWMTDDDNN